MNYMGMNHAELNSGLVMEIGEIDSQHKQIFDRLNGYLATTTNSVPGSELVSILEDMHDRLAAHFSYEEGLLSENRLALESHLSQHAQLSGLLNQSIAKVRSGNDSHIEVHSVLLSVYDWYSEHLQHEDAVFYDSRGE